MLEGLTRNARAWRIGSAFFSAVAMCLLILFFQPGDVWLAAGSGLALGAVQFMIAPEIRRLAQERLAKRRAVATAE